jgi:hypothetical protein
MIILFLILLIIHLNGRYAGFASLGKGTVFSQMIFD